MAFSVICAGPASLTGYHAHRTFDYNQTGHLAYALAGAGGGGGAPPGCCLALTMAWLHNWQLHPMVAFTTWVNPGGGGHNGVLANTVAIFAPGANWHTTTGVLMGGMGFAPAFGGLNAGPVWLGGHNTLPVIVLAATYTILIASGPAGAHAVGIKRIGNAVYFFDSNHGEIFFQAAADFGNWFFGGNYSWHCLRPVVGAVAPRFHTLRYN